MTYFPTISTFFQMNLETPNPQTDINDNNDSKRRHEDHLTALRSTIARLQRQEMESTEKIERVESELENENLTESERAELANAQTMWYGKLAAVNERLKQLRVSLASHEEEQERKSPNLYEHLISFTAKANAHQSIRSMRSVEIHYLRSFSNKWRK